MTSLKEQFASLSYLELMATGTPAPAFSAALALMAGSPSAWILAPGLAALPNLNPDTLLVCAPSVKEAYWATEQALKSGAVRTVALVLGQPYDLTQSRRFKLATEAKGTALITILPGSLQCFNSAAQERWHIAPKVSRQTQPPLSHWQQIKNKKGSLSEMEVEGYAPALSVV